MGGLRTPSSGESQSKHNRTPEHYVFCLGAGHDPIFPSPYKGLSLRSASECP